MTLRACWLVAVVSVSASPVSAAGRPLPIRVPEPSYPLTLAAEPTDAPAGPQADREWVAGLRMQVLRAESRTRLGLPKGTLVKLSFTVTETGQLVSIRGEGPPKAVERVTAALSKLGHVPAPPDHAAHPVTVPIRVK